MQMFSDYAKVGQGGSKLTTECAFSPECVCTGFRVRKGFRCVMCLRHDLTCTPGNRPAVQSLMCGSRA